LRNIHWSTKNVTTSPGLSSTCCEVWVRFHRSRPYSKSGV